MILLDTHTWVWWAADPKKLSRQARLQIDKAQKTDAVAVATISCWEVAMLVAKNRLAFSIELEDWIGQALELPSVKLLDLTPKIAILSSQLPGTLHGDPVDRILVATAKHHSCPLVTKDKKLLAYPHIQSIW